MYNLIIKKYIKPSIMSIFTIIHIIMIINIWTNFKNYYFDWGIFLSSLFAFISAVLTICGIIYAIKSYSEKIKLEFSIKENEKVIKFIEISNTNLKNMFSLNKEVDDAHINMIVSMSNQLIYSSDHAFRSLSESYFEIFYNQVKNEEFIMLNKEDNKLNDNAYQLFNLLSANIYGMRYDLNNNTLISQNDIIQIFAPLIWEKKVVAAAVTTKNNNKISKKKKKIKY